MKLVLSAFSLLFSFSNADLLNFHRHFPNATDRASLTQYSSLMSALNGYGCWCYLGQHNVGEKGKPRDYFDDQCKLLHKGYDCIIMEDPTCEPWTIDYAGSTEPDVDKLITNCALLNPGDSCKENACIVEGWFFSQYTELLSSTAGALGNYHHVDDSFDTSVCPQGLPGPGGDRECCGDYGNI